MPRVPNDFWVRNLRWSVYWRNNKGKMVRKRFKDDFHAALRFYQERLDRPAITLHVDNHSFPPPDRITKHERVVWKIVTHHGKKYKKKGTIVVNLMEEYNRKGIWWCGYCIQLRRFVQIDTEQGPEMYCPVCAASHRINRKHNPLTTTVEMHGRQRRTTNANNGRRRTRG